jgi:2-dehydro-3-deoxyphosphogluconate aldolase/(4S)-4-hydroxy-2-oxoglutarate aldolase
VFPVIAIQQAEHAVPPADALLEVGLPVAEITFRTRAAAAVIAAMAEQRPQLLIGGTWIARPEDVPEGRWATITANCRAAVLAVAAAH